MREPGVNGGAPLFCLVHSRRLACLLLPHLGDLQELQELVLELMDPDRR